MYLIPEEYSSVTVVPEQLIARGAEKRTGYKMKGKYPDDSTKALHPHIDTDEENLERKQNKVERKKDL